MRSDLTMPYPFLIFVIRAYHESRGAARPDAIATQACAGHPQ
jgi:hypothetical protein